MHITTRSDRSKSSALLYNLVLRPISSQLRKVTPNTETEGSPRLDLPKSLTKKCETYERQIANIWVYDVIVKRDSNESEVGVEAVTAQSTNVKNGNARSKATRKQKRIYYFAGGSWQMPPDDNVYKFLAVLAERVAQPAIITLVSVPLAPKNPASIAFPILVDFYDALTNEQGWVNGDEDICFMGDSSGANIALALVMWCVRRDLVVDGGGDSRSNQRAETPEQTFEVGRNGNIVIDTTAATPTRTRLRAPDSLLLISPTVDLAHSDPSLPEVSKRDPVETLDFIKSTAAAWSGADHPTRDAPALPLSDPRLSPTNGNISDLASANIQVFGVIAGDDVLGPEALTFAKKCEDAGVKGRFLYWEKQMHCFPMTATYGVIPEGKEGLEWILCALDNGGKNWKDGEKGTEEIFRRLEGGGKESDGDEEQEDRKKSRRKSIGEAKDKVKGDVKKEWSKFHVAP